MASQEVKENNAIQGKPTVLIAGACGFIGRNLVKYLVDNDLASKIRAVDKALPLTSNFSPEIEQVFGNPIVEYKQADLAQNDHIVRAFNEGPFQVVINLAGETRFGLPEPIYQEKCLRVAISLANAALEHGVERFIEVSTAQIYDPDTGKACNEDCPVKPFTVIGHAKAAAEEAVRKIPGLPLSIVRPAIVYGPGDLTGLTPRLAVGAVYKKKQKRMEMLWNAKLHLHTVHVTDVVRGIWHVATRCPSGGIHNLADQTDMDQGKINQFIGNIFGIETGFLGTITNTIAKVSLKHVADEANDEHVPVWGQLCQEHNLGNTPVSPFIDKELLHRNNIWIDGTAICQTGFEYRYPQCTEETVREQLVDFARRNMFPPTFLGADATPSSN